MACMPEKTHYCQGLRPQRTLQSLHFVSAMKMIGSIGPPPAAAPVKKDGRGIARSADPLELQSRYSQASLLCELTQGRKA